LVEELFELGLFLLLLGLELRLARRVERFESLALLIALAVSNGQDALLEKLLQLTVDAVQLPLQNRF
jgi:hypothetical protein